MATLGSFFPKSEYVARAMCRADDGGYMELRGLENFCEKYGIKIPSGDQFSLVDFLLHVSERAVPLAHVSGRIAEHISAMDKDSPDWGGCPRCGSNVHADLNECPICGLSLEEVEVEEEAKAQEPAPPPTPPRPTIREKIKTLKDDKSKAIKNLTDEVDIDDEDGIDDLDELDDHDDLDDEDEDSDDYVEPSRAAVQTDTDDLDQIEDEFIDEANAKVKPRRNRSMTREKNMAKAVRREKLRKLLPRLIENPSRALKMRYDDLLMMPGLLDYPQRPTTLGTREEIQAWVLAALTKLGKKKPTLEKRKPQP
jgi:hypothetical protein